MVNYIAVTAIEEICQERHLFVEIYRNQKECKEIPVVRIAVTEKDFGTYFPESGEWVKRRITRNTWDSYGLIWKEDYEQIRKTANVLEEENILYSKADLKRIQRFLKGIRVWDDRRWWEYIDQKQQDIEEKKRYKRETSRREKRERALKERQENTPELPKEKILEYADNAVFHKEHRLYYKIGRAHV